MRQGAYVLLWQVPGLPEYALSEDGFRRFRGKLGSHPGLEQAVADMQRPGRLTAGLDWYRANYVASLRRRWPRCRVPTLGVWGTRDRYLVERQMQNSAEHMDAPWRYVRLDGVGHWMALEVPDTVAELALGWLDAPDT